MLLPGATRVLIYVQVVSIFVPFLSSSLISDIVDFWSSMNHNKTQRIMDF